MVRFIQRLRLGLVLLAGLVISWPARAECPGGNLLQGRAPIEARGVERPEGLTDTWLSPEGSPAQIFEASRMAAPRPQVTWDLGEVRHLRAAALQGDNNDVYRLLVSRDGKDWETAWRVDPVPEPGMRERIAADLDAEGRFVRLDSPRGDAIRAVSEVKVFCAVPDVWPPERLTRATIEVPPAQTHFLQGVTAKVAFGLAALFLFLVVAPRITDLRWRQALWLGLALGALVAWTNFFQFHPGGLRIHYSDVYHYYAGPKYFEETGYFEFYRCIAKAERELGHGAEYDRQLVRDLDDNRLYPGTWSRSEAGRCRAVFSPARWEAFKADIEAFRPFTEAQVPLVRAISDHGFNASPFHSAVLRLTTSQLPINATTLGFMGMIDVAAVLIALAALWWGFGLEACALAALVFGLGHHYGYHWIGGTMARQIWLMWCCVALALLNRGRPFWGAVALTLAGLHRFFPFVFVGALGLHVLVTWARTRRLDVSGRRALAGIALTACLGLGFASLVHGPASLADHARVVKRHGSTPSGNLMGLPVLLSYSPGQTTARELADFRLSDPTELWVKVIHQRRQERAPIWITAILASLAFVGWSAYRGAKSWETVVMAGALLFSLLDMTSYDYVWLLLLAPYAVSHRPSVMALVLYGVASTVVGILVLDIEYQHLIFTPLLTVALAVVYVSAFRRIDAGGPSEGPPAPVRETRTRAQRRAKGRDPAPAPAPPA